MRRKMTGGHMYWSVSTVHIPLKLAEGTLLSAHSLESPVAMWDSQIPNYDNYFLTKTVAAFRRRFGSKCQDTFIGYT